MNIQITRWSSGQMVCSYHQQAEVADIEEQVIDHNSAEGNIYLSGVYNHSIKVILLTVVPSDEMVLKIETGYTAYQMLFMLEGAVGVNKEGADEKHQFQSGGHYIRYVHPSNSFFSIQQPFKLLIISLKEAYLKWLDPAELQLNKCLGITLAMKPIISAIISCRQICGVKRILFESKILELLFLTLDQTRQGAPGQIKGYDIKKIEKAKLLLEQNIKNPCSLIDLAHQVGLNDFKLKKGFKELYGHTVFGYLHCLRMNKAKILLLENKKVTEVANEVGYKNAQHFTAAFKKHNGILPRMLKGR